MILTLIPDEEMWLQPLRVMLNSDQLAQLSALLGDEFLNRIYVNVPECWGKHFVAAPPVVKETGNPELRLLK